MCSIVFYCVLLYSIVFHYHSKTIPGPEQYRTIHYRTIPLPFQTIPGNKPLRDDRSIPTLPCPIPGTHPVTPCSIESKIGRKSQLHTLFYPDAASPIITSTLILKCRSMFLDPTVKSLTRPFPELYKAPWGASWDFLGSLMRALRALEGPCPWGPLRTLKCHEGGHLDFLKGNASRREPGTQDNAFQVISWRAFLSLLLWRGLMGREAQGRQRDSHGGPGRAQGPGECPGRSQEGAWKGLKKALRRPPSGPVKEALKRP